MQAGVTYNQAEIAPCGIFQRASDHQPGHRREPAATRCTSAGKGWSVCGRRKVRLVRSLERDPFLAERVERLMTIPAVGPITALTWALEVGDVKRFSSIKKAISYCGLCGDEKSSAGIRKRTPISKQRNKHLQTVLVEAAKMAPRLQSGTGATI